jgi:hypothetical protein
MKSKVSVLVTINEFGAEPQGSVRCLLRRTNSLIKKNSNNNTLMIKPSKEFKHYSTIQYILALHGKFGELDSSDKSVTKIRLDNLDAEFIRAKQKNSDEYYDLVIVNMGNSENVINRYFYLSKNQSELIKTPSFKTDYEFTLVDEVVDLEESDEDSEDAE